MGGLAENFLNLHEPKFFIDVVKKRLPGSYPFWKKNFSTIGGQISQKMRPEKWFKPY